MKTSIIGYPRVGSLRELKFTTEKYFRGEISVEELQNTAKEIRKTQWTLQKNTGLDFIPSNDFSFYDMTLDTAVLFNIIPERYTKLGLSALDTYFAMARGYQGAAGDVKALAMKKWFNTNYITSGEPDKNRVRILNLHDRITEDNSKYPPDSWLSEILEDYYIRED